MDNIEMKFWQKRVLKYLLEPSYIYDDVYTREICDFFYELLSEVEEFNGKVHSFMITKYDYHSNMIGVTFQRNINQMEVEVNFSRDYNQMKHTKQQLQILLGMNYTSKFASNVVL